MKTIKVNGSISNTNWYVRNSIKLVDIDYKVLDANYNPNNDLWTLKIRRVK